MDLKSCRCRPRCRLQGSPTSHPCPISQSNCNAYERIYWDVATGRQLAQNQRDRDWHTWTCRLGFPVLGIWSESADGSDVNAVDRDPKRELLAVADDFGKVRLFGWPCAVSGAGSRVYAGHSAHVVGVRFSADGTRVVSVGGRDRAAMQWEVLRDGLSGALHLAVACLTSHRSRRSLLRVRPLQRFLSGGHLGDVFLPHVGRYLDASSGTPRFGCEAWLSCWCSQSQRWAHIQQWWQITPVGTFPGPPRPASAHLTHSSDI